MHRRPRRHALTLALIASAGCDLVVGLRPRDEPSGDAGTDASVIACDTPVLEDTFDDAPPCGNWGTATESGATLTETGGELIIALQPTTQIFGGCTHVSKTPFTESGMALEVSEVVASPEAYVVFHAFAADPEPRVSANLLYKDGRLMLFGSGDNIPKASKPYVAATMRWWRLRPDGNGVVGEYSADGATYEQLGIVIGSLPAEVKLNFGGGSGSLTTSTRAKIGHLRVCSM